MPEPSTPRLGLRRPLNDGSELVNVQTDLNQNADKLDLAAGFQIVTSTTRPGTPFSGKAIAESDTSYRTYFSNGTGPASGSWVEIPNSSGTFGSTLKLAASAQLTIGADVNLYRSAANTLKTDDTVIVGGDLKLVNGTTTFRNGLSAATTVANTTTETNLATITAPANDPAVGAVYKLTAWGRISTTGTPTFTLRTKVGSTTISTLYSAATGSGLANAPWTAELELAIPAIGAGGTFAPISRTSNNIAASGTTASVILVPAAGTIANDTTTSTTWAISGQWGTASASNTVTCQGFTAVRLA
ncbi:hypothetical protein [Streptomyces microflavus]|uniref:hypothetical protein n=1 Tax=Streptomyces microflavus TaxID=1919 RepID=UPI002E34F273|nr:hypothetical protein [Streptomyces microflavus]